MPRERRHDHADEPEPKLDARKPEIGQNAAREMRPEIVGDREVHDDDRAAEDQVEVAGDPLRVVNGRVELVAHVDQPTGAAEAEHDERERGREHDRAFPGQGGDPAEHASATPQPAGDLDRGADREDRQQGRQRDDGGERGMDKLEPGADLRVGEGMVQADRHGDNEEQDERDPRHRVAIDPPSDRARHDGVVGDVGRHQPEIDNGMQRPREEHPRQAGIDRGPHTERHGNDLQEQLERRADRRPGPQVGSGHVREHRERNRLARMGSLPNAQVDRH